MLEINAEFHECGEIEFSAPNFTFSIDYKDVKKYTAQNWRNVLKGEQSIYYRGKIEEGDCRRWAITCCGNGKISFKVSHKKGLLVCEIPIEDCKEAINDFADKIERHLYELDGEKFQESERSFQELEQN